MSDMWTIALALTDSLLVRWPLLLAAICAGVYVAALSIRRFFRWVDARIETDVLAALATEADDWHEPTRADIEATWTDEALGRVLAALDETEETFDPMALPLSQSRTARRIRAQIEANHDAEVARFREQLENYGQDGAA